MAVAATAQTVTEKRTAAAAVATKDLAVYTRTVTFPLVATYDSGNANLTGLTIPKGTMVLGGTIMSDVAQATGAVSFGVGTTANALCAATTLANSTNTLVKLATPTQFVANQDEQVIYTPSAAFAATGVATLTLILCAVGAVTGRSNSVGN